MPLQQTPSIISRPHALRGNERYPRPQGGGYDSMDGIGRPCREQAVEGAGIKRTEGQNLTVKAIPP